MEEKTIIIELEVFATGETFLCEDVPVSYTGKMFVENFLESQNITSLANAAWVIVLDRQVIDKKMKFSELVTDDDNGILKLGLMNRICAG